MEAITEQALEDLFRDIKFETQLQYVIIPKCKVLMKAPTIATAHDSDQKHVMHSHDQLGEGREDFEVIFRLLSKANVKKIIKIVVEDMEEPSHHDDAIIRSVSCFDCEEWDWKKLDLCTNIIHKAAPNATKINLYSRGSSAVLRS